MTDPEVILPGAEPEARPPSVALVSTNTASAMTMARAEIEASYILALRNPRDEVSAAAALKRACARPKMANSAAYRFPRGGSEVTGPSIYLAREAARLWGHLDSGSRVLERTDTETLVEGYARDYQTNRVARSQARFRNLIQRKQKTGQTEWVQPDERDYAEMVNRYGAKAERNAILALIPSDIIEDALEEAERTRQRVARGGDGASRADMMRALVGAFAEFGVGRKQIEERLEHPLEAATEKEIAELREIYTSIKDGQAGAAEFFSFGTKAEKAESATAAVRERVDAAKQKGASKTPKKPDEAPATEEQPTPKPAA